MMKFLFFLFLCNFCLFVKGQTKNQVSLDYIEKYKEISVKEMRTYKIPASITLSQGLLESGAGKSDLAVIANNHFGVKCHKEWSGDTFTKDDDEKDECFRKYKHPEESYEDHSAFLLRPRYSFLFDLKITDYKGWAYGLKEAGYATDPKYPQKLIGIIELYELYQYDVLVEDKSDKKAEKKQKEDSNSDIANEKLQKEKSEEEQLALDKQYQDKKKGYIDRIKEAKEQKAAKRAKDIRKIWEKSQIEQNPLDNKKTNSSQTSVAPNYDTDF